MKNIFRKHFPKLYSILRILLKKPITGPFYDYNSQLSPDIKIYESEYKVFRKYVEIKLKEKNKKLKFLDVGGGETISEKAKYVSEGTEYYCLDIMISSSNKNFIKGDITNCPKIQDEEFDIVFCDNLFEHISEPWKAYKEIGRILKPSGICFNRTLFSWLYHPYPNDYWRYTHNSLIMLAEKYGGLKTVEYGYNIKNRRCNIAGGQVKENRDGCPIDGYGAWLEGWVVFHIGKKENKI